MDYAEYQQQARRTMDQTLTPEERIELCLWGIPGEVGEVIDLWKKERFHRHPRDKDKYRKEIGDVVWYVANLCHETATEFFPHEAALQLWRKVGYDMKLQLRTLAEEAACFDMVDPRRVLTLLIHIASLLDLGPFEDILDLNIAKLKARYPDGFSTEASLSRKE
jgi:NTP pyrophosphatase (non-canonical NTP hydrolase)